MYYPPHHDNVTEDMILDEVENTFRNTRLWIEARIRCYFRSNPGVNCYGVTSGPAKDCKVNMERFIQGEHLVYIPSPVSKDPSVEHCILSLGLV